MRFTLLNDKVLNKELAMSIYLSNGVVYANKGMILTKRTINALLKVGIDTVYIKDGNDDINLKETLKTPIRLEVTNELKDIFSDIKKDNFINEEKLLNIAEKIVSNIDSSENSFLLNNIGEKDNELKLITHSINVAVLSILVGINRQYTVDQLKKLAVGAILHDVGKLLDDSQKHTLVGYNIVKNNSRLPVTSYMCILHHHELEDGTGYPEKIKGDKVHEFSKIVCICNHYTNLLQSPKFNLPNEVMEFISFLSGKKFNENICKSFNECIYCYPNGLHVKLSNGQEGVVVLQNKNFPTRPMVGVIENGTPVVHNLMEDLSLLISEILI